MLKCFAGGCAPPTGAPRQCTEGTEGGEEEGQGGLNLKEDEVA